MQDRLVWVPFDPADVGPVPDGLRVEQYNPAAHSARCSDAGEVGFVVLPFGTGRDQRRLLDRMSRLDVVQAQSAGVEHLRGAVPPGVTLCNGRGVHDTATAELALTLVLASLRGIPDFVRGQDVGEWRFGFRTSLADKQVLVVGYGSVGEAIERRALAFEAKVTRVARRGRPGVHPIDELPRLLPAADVVVVAVPETAQTRGLFDAAMLGEMKDGALLVNVARGPVVDTGSLLAELASGRLRAALDVVDPEPLPVDHPLWSVPGLVLSPHVGGCTDAMAPRVRRLVAAQLARYGRGEPLANVVAGDY